MAREARANPTAILLFIGVISLQFGTGWRVRGEATTPGLGEESVTVRTSSAHNLPISSSPRPSVTTQPRPPTPGWLRPHTTDSAPRKPSLNTTSVTSGKGVLPGVNTTSQHLTNTSAKSIHNAVEQNSVHNELQQEQPHSQEVKTHSQSEGGSDHPDLFPLEQRLRNVSSREQLTVGRGENVSGPDLHLMVKDKQSNVQNVKSNSLDAPSEGGLSLSFSGTVGGKTGVSGVAAQGVSSSATGVFTERTDSLDDPAVATSLSNHTNHTDPESWRSRSPFKKPSPSPLPSPSAGDSAPNAKSAPMGSKQGPLSLTHNRTLVEASSDSRLGTGTGAQSETRGASAVPLEPEARGMDTGVTAKEDTETHSGARARIPPGERERMFSGVQHESSKEDQSSSSEAQFTLDSSSVSSTEDVNITASGEADRTNASSSNRSRDDLEEALVDALLANSSSSSSAESSNRSHESDEEYEDYDDYEDDSEEDTDWHYNNDDDGRDYYDDEGGLASSNRADTGNDDYEYETSDQAVEDMRPGSDNYYRGSKLSDEEWIREKSKVDMSDIAASHPGQEVFVGPHTFEAEFGPISEVRSETMEMHQPFVPQSSHDASLGILVFYTWIGIVTVMVIGAFIAVKHRHRIASYVWDARTGYRKKGTVCATEEGRNLLTTVM